MSACPLHKVRLLRVQQYISNKYVRRAWNLQSVSETKFINLFLEIQGFHPVCISCFSDSMVKPYGQGSS